MCGCLFQGYSTKKSTLLRQSFSSPLLSRSMDPWIFFHRVTWSVDSRDAFTLTTPGEFFRCCGTSFGETFGVSTNGWIQRESKVREMDN